MENIENEVIQEPLVEQIEFVEESGVEIIPGASGFELVSRTPAVIAAEINVIKAQTAAVIHTLSGHIRSGVYEIGRLLCEAKASVPHGEWGEWLEVNVAYSDSTAQNLMRIYRELSDGQVDMLTGKTQAELFAGLDYSQVIEVLKLPKDERARLAEENDLAGMSSREIKALIKEKKALEEKVAAQDDEIVELMQAKGKAEMQVTEEKNRADSLEKAKAVAEDALKKADSERDKAVRNAVKEHKSELKKISAELEELKASAPVGEISAEEIERIKAEAIAEVEAKHKVNLEQVTLEADNKVEAARAEAEAEAEKRIEELKAKYAAASDDTVKVVSVYIEQLTDILNKITERVDVASPEVKEKLSGAVKHLLLASSEGFN